MLSDSFHELVDIALTAPVLDSPEEEEEFIEKLRFFFDDNLLLAALDLVDRESVIYYTTTWGQEKYEVLGATTTYSVFPGRNERSRPAYCTCPSFAYSVLLSGTQTMCKHLLATILAKRLSKCVQRSMGPNELARAVMYCPQSQ